MDAGPWWTSVAKDLRRPGDGHRLVMDRRWLGAMYRPVGRGQLVVDKRWLEDVLRLMDGCRLAVDRCSSRQAPCSCADADRLLSRRIATHGRRLEDGPRMSYGGLPATRGAS